MYLNFKALEYYYELWLLSYKTINEFHAKK